MAIVEGYVKKYNGNAVDKAQKMMWIRHSDGTVEVLEFDTANDGYYCVSVTEGVAFRVKVNRGPALKLSVDEDLIYTPPGLGSYSLDCRRNKCTVNGDVLNSDGSPVTTAQTMRWYQGSTAVTRAFDTDATGLYGFVSLPAGTYAVKINGTASLDSPYTMSVSFGNKDFRKA